MRGGDVPDVRERGQGHAGDWGGRAERADVSYVQVDNLEDVKAAVKRAGSVHAGEEDVLWIDGNRRERPAGHFITFAQFAPAPQK